MQLMHWEAIPVQTLQLEVQVTLLQVSAPAEVPLLSMVSATLPFPSSQSTQVEEAVHL